MRKYLRTELVLLVLVFSVSCQAQKEPERPKAGLNPLGMNWSDSDPYFQETNTITTSYGPSSITRNIMQDRKGNIWLASWEGIMRYDGTSFTNFTNKERLRRYHVFSVLEDSKGNLWFGTIGAGVYRYDGKKFTNITTKDGLAHDRVGCFYEDKAGNIWMGTEGGISVYDGKSIRNFTTEEGLTNNDINAIIEDKSGKFWFGTRGEACFYDGKTFTKFTNKEGAPFNNVRSIIEDKKGNIWLGGNDGLWRYDGNALTNYSRSFVGYIYEDKKGDIWTSSEVNRGTWALSRYEEKSLLDNTVAATPIRTEQGMFFGIVEDAKGGIWLGSLQGVSRYDGTSFNNFSQ